ncbi:hypothetical protein [Limnoglobus roseus]|uniref:Uncharacterized protein n=1 Tax=Limnoglobus roseus TaxID=2598579 RepID=A0A5C1ARW9_9BACT|nr:hypothetical protein [Limnoglobus roseus]QEL20897.1 hypothetical protein PX52LOC_08018 [Limnoglobus roseus]
MKPEHDALFTHETWKNQKMAGVVCDATVIGLNILVHHYSEQIKGMQRLIGLLRAEVQRGVRRDGDLALTTLESDVARLIDSKERMERTAKSAAPVN